MMPGFLAELKKRGYHVVHIVAGPGEGETAPAPAGWVSETGRTIDAHQAAARGSTNAGAGPIVVKPAPEE